MEKIIEVKDIHYKSGYVYRITFNDGTSGDIDFEEYLKKGSIFSSLSNIDLFKKAFINGGTIAWPNGADIAPKTIFEKISGKNSIAAWIKCARFIYFKWDR